VCTEDDKKFELLDNFLQAGKRGGGKGAPKAVGVTSNGELSFNRKAMEKTIKRRAAKDHRFMPYARRDTAPAAADS
jgi:hypothetical protein